MGEYLTKPMQAQGLTVRAELMHAAALRYFDTQGAFATAVRAATGVAMPDVLQAVQGGGGELVLAWRGPTETLLLTPNAAQLAQLQERVAACADGCAVNLTGGLGALRVSGEPCADLLCRLGGSGCVPAVGEARRARLADVPVLALCLKEGETLLVVDRALAPHLCGWIQETLLDFPAA